MTRAAHHLLLLSAVLLTVACSAKPGPSYPDWPTEPLTTPVVLLGDLQRTSYPELLIGREDNDAVRPHLIAAIAQEHPGALFLLGDMVFDGSDADDWYYFDALMVPLAQTPILPVLGNHDYWGLDSNARAQFNARFPRMSTKTWYSVRDRGVAWIVLDSNQDSVGDAGWKQQQRWFADMLAEYATNPSVRGAVVLLHHPPFTNSEVTSDEMHVQSAFLPTFSASPITLAMVTGHAHTYERFERDGKMFIVSGGGGGPRVGLLKGDDRRHHDDRVSLPAPRPFHYIQVNPSDTGLAMTVKGCTSASTPVATLDAFVIPWAK